MVSSRSCTRAFYGQCDLVYHQGGPYVPTDNEVVSEMLQAAGELKGKSVVDLGSGDGRIVLAAAKAGAEASGYEINPKLVLSSRRAIKKAGLEGKAHIFRRNMWHADVSQMDIVFLYQIKHTMPWLEKKLMAELPKDAIIISNYFQFPNLEARQVTERVRVYRKIT